MTIDSNVQTFGPLTPSQVVEFIPHRDPFLFVDAIDEIIPGLDDNNQISPVGTVVRGRRVFTDKEPFFKGHFPDYPITPGVIVTESIGQIGTFVFYPFLEPKKLQRANGDLLKLVGVNSARYRGPVLPNDELVATVKLIRGKKGIWILDATAEVNGKIVVECELIASYNLDWKK